MMKHKKTANFLLVCTLVTGISLGSFSYLGAETSAAVEDLNTQRDAKRKELDQLKAQVASLQKQINTQRNKIASLNNEIALFDLEITQTQQQIDVLAKEIDVTNLDIIDTLRQVNETEKRVETKKSLLKDLIMQIYEYDQASPLEVVLAHENFSDMLSQIENTVTFQEKNQSLLDELHALQADLAAKQQVLEQKKTQLNTLKGQAESTKAALEQQQNQKESLLSYTRGQESRYRAMLDNVSEEEARVNQEVYDLDQKIRAQLGDKALPTVNGTFVWPMEGILTQGYGNTGFTKLGYNFHNGIDIAAPANTPIYAAADGVVYATGTGKTAYGNWVVIKHNVRMPDGSEKRLYTLYGHMNRIATSSGRNVLAGDAIGYEGNTGNTTRILYGPERGYHLHFTVYDEEGFGIADGANQKTYGAYKVPFGYTYNPMKFLK